MNSPFRRPRFLHPLLGCGLAFGLGAAALGCTAEVSPPGATGATGAGAAAGAGGSGATAGTTPAGGSAGTAGSGSGAVGGTAPTGGASGAGGSSGTGGTGVAAKCTDQAAVTPGRAPIRRLTKFEYNVTVADLLGDDTKPALALTSELLGNGFGNDADAQPTSGTVVPDFAKIAEDVANRATATPEALAKLHACAGSVTDATQQACARSIIESLAPKAYRRPVTAEEVNELVTLSDSVYPVFGFASAVAAVIEAMLQSPEYLYRVEFGEPAVENPALKRPTGFEMAARLSYLFWQSMPDAELTAAAQSGALSTAAGVRAQAERLLASPRTRQTVRFFFDNLLPISSITDVSRDPVAYPGFSSTIASLMQQETRTFLDYVVFDGAGTWPAALEADYTFVNGPLAAYYGMPAVTGDAFQRVPVDTTQRLGLLTQGAFLVGTTPSNHTNPVLRGGFIAGKLMCREVSLPTDPEILSQVAPPDPYSGATGRERFSQHSANPVCLGCHVLMDPMGFALENYDAVGAYRATENGVVIDASGNVPGNEETGEGSVDIGGPIDLARALAQNPEVQACFASHWANFAYGQTLHEDAPADVCTQESLATAFAASGHNIKQLLLDLTQQDAFLYLGSQEQ
jgi:hypothetical protein